MVPGDPRPEMGSVPQVQPSTTGFVRTIGRSELSTLVSADVALKMPQGFCYGNCPVYDASHV